MSAPTRSLIGPQAAAALLGVSTRTVYRMAASGRIPSYRVGQQLRFDPDEVRASLKRERVAS